MACMLYRHGTTVAHSILSLATIIVIWHIHYVLPLCNASTNIHCEKQVASSSVTFDAISYVVAYYAMACLICDDSAS